MQNVNYNTGQYESGDQNSMVRQLNSLLRGEISAAETYRMAIDKVDKSVSGNQVQILQQMHQEHGRAAQLLRECVRDLGGEPSDSSGAWGAFAQGVQGTMNVFGDASALKSLKEGEEHGLKDYQEAVDDVDVRSADLIRTELIPAQERHIALLDQLISTTGRA